MTMKLFPARSAVEKPRIETKNDVAYQALEKSRLDDLPYIEAQEELEALFDKNQLKKQIRAVYDTDDFTRFYEKADLPAAISRAFCLDVLIQMAIHKRTKPSALIGMLYYHFDAGGSKMAALQECADALEILIHKDFVDYSVGRDELVVRYEVPADVQKELDRFQYPLPMMVQPRPLKTNWDNGYIGKTTRKSLVVLKAGNATEFYSDADICLDHLERMNKIPLALNLEVVALIDNSWSDLDKKRPNETLEEYKRRLKAFEKYDESSKDVITALSQLRDRFWLTHKYDRRGRTYCQGYHVTYQGNPWNKAVIEFADKEELKNE